MKKALPFVFTFLCHPVVAGSFSVYDARSQAMGGAAVALGSVNMAAGHNPALLGLYDEDEDRSKNGRFYLPYVAGDISQATLDAIQLINDELDVSFDTTLDNYNIAPAADSAALASDSARQLENALTDIANKDISFNVFINAISVAEPAELGGGGFYLGSRIVGGGRSFIPDEDIDLFHNYVEALTNVAAGGYWRDVHPELFNADAGYVGVQPPPLIDPETNSRADLRGFIINEAAVGAAWGYDFDDMRIAVGATPKAMYVRVFDESREISANDLEATSVQKPQLMFNVDIGVAVELSNGFRVAYSGKDLVTRTFATANDQSVRLESKHRMGIALIRPQWQVGADVDMQQQQPYATERTGQYLVMGGEYTLFERFNLRAGYQFDLKHQHSGVISVGFGLQWRNMLLESSFKTGSDEKGGALQLGFRF